MRNREKWFKAAFIVFAVAAMAYLIDFSELIALLAELSMPLFLVVVLIVIADQAFMGAKWSFLLRVFHVSVPMQVPVMAYLRGRIFQFLAPSSLGIDAYKTFCVKKYHPEISPIVSSIIVERMFGALSSLAFILLLLPFCMDFLGLPYKEYVGLMSFAGFATLCIILHLLLVYAEQIMKLKLPKIFPKKLKAAFQRLVINLAKITDGRPVVWSYFFFSILEKASYGMAVYFSASALGLEEPGFLLVVSVAPIIALLERLPVSVSAIGIREGLFVLLYAPFYDDPTVPLTVSLVLRAAEIVQIGLFLVTWFGGRDKKEIDKEISSVEVI